MREVMDEGEGKGGRGSVVGVVDAGFDFGALDFAAAIPVAIGLIFASDAKA